MDILTFLDKHWNELFVLVCSLILIVTVKDI